MSTLEGGEGVSVPTPPTINITTFYSFDNSFFLKVTDIFLSCSSSNTSISLCSSWYDKELVMMTLLDCHILNAEVTLSCCILLFRLFFQFFNIFFLCCQSFFQVSSYEASIISFFSSSTP